MSFLSRARRWVLVFLFVADARYAPADFVILFGAIIKRNRAVPRFLTAGNRIVVRRSGRLDLRPGAARRSRYDLKPPTTRQPYAPWLALSENLASKPAFPYVERFHLVGVSHLEPAAGFFPAHPSRRCDVGSAASSSSSAARIIARERACRMS